MLKQRGSFHGTNSKLFLQQKNMHNNLFIHPGTPKIKIFLTDILLNIYYFEQNSVLINSTMTTQWFFSDRHYFHSGKLGSFTLSPRTQDGWEAAELPFPSFLCMAKM